MKFISFCIPIKIWIFLGGYLTVKRWWDTASITVGRTWYTQVCNSKSSGNSVRASQFRCGFIYLVHEWFTSTPFWQKEHFCRYKWESFASLYIYGTHLLSEAEAYGTNFPYQLQWCWLNCILSQLKHVSQVPFSRSTALICLSKYHTFHISYRRSNSTLLW